MRSRSEDGPYKRVGKYGRDDKLLITMQGHAGEKYGLTVYLGIDDELCIEDTMTGIDVLDTAHFIEDYQIYG